MEANTEGWAALVEFIASEPLLMLGLGFALAHINKLGPTLIKLLRYWKEGKWPNGNITLNDIDHTMQLLNQKQLRTNELLAELVGYVKAGNESDAAMAARQKAISAKLDQINPG